MFKLLGHDKFQLLQMLTSSSTMRIDKRRKNRHYVILKAATKTVTQGERTPENQFVVNIYLTYNIQKCKKTCYVKGFILFLLLNTPQNSILLKQTKLLHIV
jgi:hypothetical protein